MIELKNLSKHFDTASGGVDAVQDVSLTINDGDIFGIIGLSGAGKSTLVRCINLLERPTEGEVLLDGEDLCKLSPSELRKRRRQITMIFQGFNLLSQRTALANVCYPMEIAGVKKSERIGKARKLLGIVGLSDRENSYPSQLSGGQKQRVAIARALATDPKVLLCDEATSALDPNTTRSILALLKEINEKMGVTIIVITHEMKVVEQICNRVAVLDGGKVVETGNVSDVFVSPKSAMARELILPKGGAVKDFRGGKIIRLVFDGGSSFEPVVANICLECRAAVNIMGADTKDIGGRAFGQMLLQLPEDEGAQKRILGYLDSRGLTYEEVKRVMFDSFLGEGMTAIYSSAIYTTLKITLISTLLAYLIGTPLGVLLYCTDKDGIFPNKAVNTIIGFIVNVLRSVPFMILLVMTQPLARALVGTSIGDNAFIVYLLLAAAPFVARMVESRSKRSTGASSRRHSQWDPAISRSYGRFCFPSRSRRCL